MEDELTQHLLSTPSARVWQKIGMRKRAGLLSGLFSVYSQESIGIGDFRDLKLLVDFSCRCGLSILQLLPMNEVGALFCPYESQSSFALEPMYLSLRDLVAGQESRFGPALEKLKQAFPAGRPHLDYRIKAEKLKLLKEIYLEIGSRDEKPLEEFRKCQAYWLEDFALYKALKAFHSGQAWYLWPQGLKERDKNSLKLFVNEHRQEIGFQRWLQLKLCQQFSSVKDYCLRQGVLLMGDLPLLVSRDSADVWQHPEFFKLEFAAGAPPDMYCAQGQRWGMPTYNWEAIAADNFRYLKEKLGYARTFYDILRIDHVVGLFRIWSIPYNEPLENQGLNGFFDPAEESKWQPQAERILRVMLEAGDMLLCAEDLGVIPRICPQTLKQLGIPGNDVQRWSKGWDTTHDFLSPADYRWLSVTMLSTHDTTNFAAWWLDEAGTVDEALFIRKCCQYDLDYQRLKPDLFNLRLSRRGRLRWLEKISSPEQLAGVLGRKTDELRDIINLYLNSYGEKNKFWRWAGLKGRFGEGFDQRLLLAALRMNLDSAGIFSIQTMIDWLFPYSVFNGPAFQQRINTPGSISPDNWSLTIPLKLEDLLRHPLSKQVRELVVSAQRAG
jgi:4-alpha-glucanotransferase